MAEHWHSKPKAPGFDSQQLHLSFGPFPSHFKGLQTVMARLRSLIRPSVISPQTKANGVSTIGLSTMITLKIHLNQHYSCIIMLTQCICMDYMERYSLY